MFRLVCQFYASENTIMGSWGVIVPCYSTPNEDLQLPLYCQTIWENCQKYAPFWLNFEEAWPHLRMSVMARVTFIRTVTNPIYEI